MKLDIRTWLTIRFTLIVALILTIFSIGIYWFSANYRESEFYSRLENKAVNTARLLLEVKEVDYNLLKIIDKNTIQALYQENVEIFDYTDRHIYSSLDDDTFQISKALLDEVRIKKLIHFHLGKDEAIGLLFKERGKNYIVIASAYDKFGRSKLNYLKWLLLAGFFVSIGLSVFLGRINAGGSLKPMSDIVQQVEKITFDSLHMRVNEGNEKDEIAHLGMTFNRMLERLESASEMHRSFVSNASHELRTPLTSITGQIEVALMKPRTNNEYKVILESLLEDISNLNELTNGLLDLAKASSDVSSIIMEPLRIDEILLETQTELIRRKSKYSVSSQFSHAFEDEKELTVFGNHQLLKTAMLNLMDNACKFSPDTSVEVMIDKKEGNVILTFSDKGIGIDKEDMVTISQPFFRAKNAKTIHGSGLGLALSSKIIQLHKGTVKIDSRVGIGTAVTVTIPTLT